MLSLEPGTGEGEGVGTAVRSHRYGLDATIASRCTCQSKTLPVGSTAPWAASSGHLVVADHCPKACPSADDIENPHASTSRHTRAAGKQGKTLGADFAERLSPRSIENAFASRLPRQDEIIAV